MYDVERASSVPKMGMVANKVGGWWWISGDTYVHRAILKAAGARWSPKREAWYCTKPDLPAAIQRLLEPAAERPAHEGQPTAAPSAGALPPGSRPIHERRDDSIDATSASALDHSTPRTEQIRVGSGTTFTVTTKPLTPYDYLPASRDTSPRGDDGADPVQPTAPVFRVPGTPALGTPILSTPALSTPAERTGTPVPAFDFASPGQLAPTYIGRVNVVGDCYCFGVVIDRRPPSYRPLPVYVNVAGPATSVEAVWAKLAQGKETAVIPDDKTSQVIPLAPNKAGLYKRFQRRIEALGIDHLILIHKSLAEPASLEEERTEDSVTYLLATSEEQLRAKIGEQVRQVVKIAIFENWHAHLLQAGFQHGLLHQCVGYGATALGMKLDASAWTTLIRDGLQKGSLLLP